MPSFQQAQYQFTRHLRDPDQNPAPGAIEDRRMGIYRDLIYNNIESFIRGAFPILRSIMNAESWHRMVRHFVATHQSHTPYFLEISQEFLQYLMQEHIAREDDPAFMLELAHYEWVELALDVSTETVPDAQITAVSTLDGRPQISPLVWCLSYRFPVHRVGPEYQPTEPPDTPSFLVVYRNRMDEVKFLEANAVTMRLLQLLQANNTLTGREVLHMIATELQHPDPVQLEKDGELLIEQLLSQDIIANLH